MSKLLKGHRLGYNSVVKEYLLKGAGCFVINFFQSQRSYGRSSRRVQISIPPQGDALEDGKQQATVLSDITEVNTENILRRYEERRERKETTYKELKEIYGEQQPQQVRPDADIHHATDTNSYTGGEHMNMGKGIESESSMELQPQASTQEGKSGQQQSNYQSQLGHFQFDAMKLRAQINSAHKISELKILLDRYKDLYTPFLVEGTLSKIYYLKEPKDLDWSEVMLVDEICGTLSTIAVKLLPYVTKQQLVKCIKVFWQLGYSPDPHLFTSLLDKVLDIQDQLNCSLMCQLLEYIAKFHDKFQSERFQNIQWIEPQAKITQILNYLLNRLEQEFTFLQESDDIKGEYFEPNTAQQWHYLNQISTKYKNMDKQNEYQGVSHRVLYSEEQELQILSEKLGRDIKHLLLATTFIKGLVHRRLFTTLTTFLSACYTQHLLDHIDQSDLLHIWWYFTVKNIFDGPLNSALASLFLARPFSLRLTDVERLLRTTVRQYRIGVLPHDMANAILEKIKGQLVVNAYTYTPNQAVLIIQVFSKVCKVHDMEFYKWMMPFVMDAKKSSNGASAQTDMDMKECVGLLESLTRIDVFDPVIFQEFLDRAMGQVREDVRGKNGGLGKFEIADMITLMYCMGRIHAHSINQVKSLDIKISAKQQLMQEQLQQQQQKQLQQQQQQQQQQEQLNEEQSQFISQQQTQQYQQDELQGMVAQHRNQLQDIDKQSLKDRLYLDELMEILLNNRNKATLNERNLISILHTLSVYHYLPYRFIDQLNQISSSLFKPEKINDDQIQKLFDFNKILQLQNKKLDLCQLLVQKQSIVQNI